uniref:Glutathione S-transferase kappa n=1 Tax=Panagrolaimus sp. JU765 TaxID=591449 RepID=A0AC34QIL4_9BILA
MKTTIDLYFDIISPYSWIAFESLLRYAPKLPAEIRFKPFYLAGIMKASQNRPPATVPAKGVQMLKDLECLGRYWGIPIRPPSDFVGSILTRNNVLAVRFLTAVEQTRPKDLPKLATILWSRIWSQDLPVHDEKSIYEAAQEAGLDFSTAKQLLEQANSDDIRDLLKQRTEEAVASGAFGAPWIVVHEPGKPEKTFFGSDRLPMICNELGVDFEGPLKSKM